jgi:ABC-type transport system substrate-binding protein
VDRAVLERNRTTRAQLYIQAQHIALSQGAWISLNYAVNQVLVKPYVHGLVGTEVYSSLVPRDGDWTNVSIARH